MSSHIVPVTGTIQTVISSIINNRTSITVEQQLADHLDRIPITERLGKVQNLLLAISEADVVRGCISRHDSLVIGQEGLVVYILYCSC